MARDLIPRPVTSGYCAHTQIGGGHLLVAGNSQSGAGLSYRGYLFQDLQASLRARPRRILEIGPKDGEDTRRLLTLAPDHLTLLDLPGRAVVAVTSGQTVVEYVAGDVLTVEVEDDPVPEPFDLIWCTGVLYHVREPYRLLTRLCSWLRTGGFLVLESATIRRWWLRAQNCVEVLYPPSVAVKRAQHLSLHITHLPSARAVASWLAMAGFVNIQRSDCHRRVSRALARHRVAYLASRA